jgi:hypothetical protein
MKYLCSDFLADLPFIRDRGLLADIFVQGDNSFCSAGLLTGFDFLNDEPLLQVPFSAIEMCVILGF